MVDLPVAVSGISSIALRSNVMFCSERKKPRKMQKLTDRIIIIRNMSEK